MSPAVSEGEHGKYWIDIREANLEKVELQNSFLFPRIVSDLFVLESLSEINRFLSIDLMEYRAHSGNVWGLYMELNISQMTATLVSKRNSMITLTTELISKLDITEKIRGITG